MRAESARHGNRLDLGRCGRVGPIQPEVGKTGYQFVGEHLAARKGNQFRVIDQCCCAGHGQQFQAAGGGVGGEIGVLRKILLELVKVRENIGTCNGGIIGWVPIICILVLGVEGVFQDRIKPSQQRVLVEIREVFDVVSGRDAATAVVLALFGQRWVVDSGQGQIFSGGHLQLSVPHGEDRAHGHPRVNRFVHVIGRDSLTVAPEHQVVTSHNRRLGRDGRRAFLHINGRPRNVATRQHLQVTAALLLQGPGLAATRHVGIAGGAGIDVSNSATCLDVQVAATQSRHALVEVVRAGEPSRGQAWF